MSVVGNISAIKYDFSIPNLNEGFFEQPTMAIDSLKKVSTRRWHINATASAAYCANFCRNPQLCFAFSFRHNCCVNEGKTIEAQIGINVVENVPTTTTSAKSINTLDQASIENFKYSFRNQQKPFRAFCDEYGPQYRTHLTIKILLEFDVVLSSKEQEEKEEEEEEEKEEEEQKVPEKEDERDAECCVCLDERATMMNEICKHTVMCHTCAFAFLSKSKTLQQPYTCPICRSAIGNMYIDTKTIK